MKTDLIAYLISSYFFIGILVLVLNIFTRSRPGARVRFSIRKRLVLSVILLLLPVYPYAHIEVLSKLLTPSLTPAVHEALKYKGDECKYYEAIVGTELRYLKVLHATPWNADVYFVTYKKSRPGKDRPFRDYGYSGFFATFERSKGKWVFNGPCAFWTDMGNANAKPPVPYPARGDFR